MPTRKLFHTILFATVFLQFTTCPFTNMLTGNPDNHNKEIRVENKSDKKDLPMFLSLHSTAPLLDITGPHSSPHENCMLTSDKGPFHLQVIATLRLVI